MVLTQSVPKNEQILQRYQAIRQQSIALCTPLELEDYCIQPTVDVSPPKWHLGHTTWFFENFILIPQVKDYQPFDLRLNWFFNSYYESQGHRINRSNRGNMSRPTVEQILKYRAHVDQAMQAFLEPSSEWEESLWLTLIVGLQHEQQHQELLLTDIKYILGHNPLFPSYGAPPHPITSPSETQWLSIAEGLYEIGYEGDNFCWDNERSKHQVFLPAYTLQNRLVTNQEFLAFIEDGGYQRHEFWQMEGLEWVKQQETSAPLYWIQHEGQWMEYTMHGLQALRPDLPVTHVNYYEADAFARWKGLRLPTEFEWEVACKKHHGISPTQNTGVFLEDAWKHPGPAHQDDDQFFGHAWEWTSSAYLPYPGYPRFSGALGEYNGKFMINQMVLRGGSSATPRDHIRATYRNFFHPDKRWQVTGIRLAK